MKTDTCAMKRCRGATWLLLTGKRGGLYALCLKHWEALAAGPGGCCDRVADFCQGRATK